MRTRSGIKPTENEREFTIRTSHVETFIQEKMNSIVKMMEAGKPEKNIPPINPGPINIFVYTVKLSKKFTPMMLVLSSNALEKKGGKKNKPKNEMSIFSQDGRHSSVKLWDPIDKIVKAYAYSTEELNALNNHKVRTDMGLVMTKKEVIDTFGTPKIQYIGKNKHVFIMIDPIKVFMDMLDDLDDNRSFYIDIDDKRHIQNSEYEYVIRRKISKKGKKKTRGGDASEQDIEESVLRAVGEGGRRRNTNRRHR